MPPGRDPRDLPRVIPSKGGIHDNQFGSRAGGRDQCWSMTSVPGEGVKRNKERLAELKTSAHYSMTSKPSPATTTPSSRHQAGRIWRRGSGNDVPGTPGNASVTGLGTGPANADTPANKPPVVVRNSLQFTAKGFDSFPICIPLKVADSRCFVKSPVPFLPGGYFNSVMPYRATMISFESTVISMF